MFGPSPPPQLFPSYILSHWGLSSDKKYVISLGILSCVLKSGEGDGGVRSTPGVLLDTAHGWESDMEM